MPRPLQAHDHLFLGADHDENARRTLWVVALTLVMMVGEITAGYITGSMALLADGLHMATHAGALGISAAAYAYARRHAHSPSFSFGTGKVGDLGGFASALILGLVALGIGVESLVRLLQPTSVQFGTATLIAMVGLMVNILSALLLAGHGHGHHHHGDHDHDHDHHQGGHGHGTDNNLKSAYVHVVADALTSVLAILALLAGRFLGWVWLDPTMGLVGAVVIGRWAWSLLGATAGVLLDRTPANLAAQIRERVEGIAGSQLLDLHVWQVGPQAHAAIVSVTGQAPASAEAIRDRLAGLPELRHLTVEFQAA